MSEAVRAAAPTTRTTRSHATTREVWLERIARFPASGLTPAQFCAIEAVSLPSFYSWKRRLAAEARAPASAQHSDAQSGPRLLPVRLAPAAAAVELVLPSGAVLRVPPGCDLTFVRALLDALGDAPC